MIPHFGPGSDLYIYNESRRPVLGGRDGVQRDRSTKGLSVSTRLLVPNCLQGLSCLIVYSLPFGKKKKKIYMEPNCNLIIIRDFCHLSSTKNGCPTLSYVPFLCKFKP